VAGEASRTRRAPAPEERRRDAERTKRALLDAALVEFADKGRAGARVSAIADRAGVNKQLISYYFGGKDGLYEALGERWLRQEAAWASEGLPLPELVTRYLEVAVAQRDLARLFFREMLDADLAAPPRTPPGEVSPDLADLRRRQAAGELAPDVDPALALLLVQGAVSVGVTFATDVRDLAGVDPRSPEFLERYGALLRRVVRRPRPEPEARARARAAPPHED
jgi:AcrR family transcriptional regulator